MTEQSFIPGPDGTRALRDAFGTFATGVTLVTAPGPVAIVANSFASVSLDPPLVLWSPARASSRFAAFATAARFAVHVLAADQRGLVNRFARAGEGFDDDAEVSTGPGNVPQVAGCLARFDCERVAAHDGGDHLIIVGRVIHVRHRPGEPLLFAAGAFGGFARGAA